MEIKGIIAAMATAMHDDGSINEQEIRRQVNRHIAAGVDGVVLSGNQRRVLYSQRRGEKAGHAHLCG